MNKSFIDSKFYKIMEYIASFFISNLMFLICSLPFFISLLIMPIAIENSLLYFVLLLFTGPAFSALLSSVRRLRQIQAYVGMKVYFEYYKKNFIISSLFSSFITTGAYILLIDTLYFLNKGYGVIAWFFGALVLLAILVYFNGMMIITGYDITLKNLLKSSIVSLIFNGKHSIYVLLTVGIPLAIVVLFPKESVLIIFSVFAFFLLQNIDSMLLSLEKFEDKQ